MTRSVLALAAACCALAGARPARAAAQRPDQGYIVTSDSARLFYKVAGHPGPGIDTIIAIHGGPGLDLESIYNDFAAGLAATHVVIFYDQRGGGKSELPADTTRLVAARQVRDLDEVRRHFHLERVTLVAHSYGPLLAASYAIAHPAVVKKMVFFGPVPPRRGDFFARYGRNINARLDSAQRAAMAAATAVMTSETATDAQVRRACRDYWAIGLRPRLAQPDVGLRLVTSDLCATDPAGIRYGTRTANHVIMDSYGDWDLRPALNTLDVPLLVVHGEEETIPMDLVQEWVTSMPNARLFRVPNAAHFTYAEQSALVWPEVERFLARRAPASYQVGRIRTRLGEILFVLYDQTPRHKASFIRLASEHYWDTLTFNRVIKNFVAQGGCPDTPQGFANSPYLLAPEFRKSLRHVYGAVGAGRDDNPGQLSAGCQFYIVANPHGLPKLDDHYTVYGQVFKGMDVVEQIVSVPKDSTNKPLTPIPLRIDVITMTADAVRRAGFVRR